MTFALAAVLLASAAPHSGAPAATDPRRYPLVAAPAPAGGPGAPAAHVPCDRRWAGRAGAEAPAARTLGLGAAQYFLGRIDAVAPGYDLAHIAPIRDDERADLVRRCSEALNAGGFDLPALGAS